jgi:hypothetical protein
MRKNSSKQVQTQYQKIASKVKSWSLVWRNGWAIKFSTNGETILLFFHSQMTNQTFVRFFIDENDAVNFINFIISHDASLELPQ